MNMNRPDYCHVRTAIRGSMWNVTYSMYLLLHFPDHETSIARATCPCAAGLVSYTILHISPLIEYMYDCIIVYI